MDTLDSDTQDLFQYSDSKTFFKWVREHTHSDVAYGQRKRDAEERPSSGAVAYGMCALDGATPAAASLR